MRKKKKKQKTTTTMCVRRSWGWFACFGGRWRSAIIDLETRSAWRTGYSAFAGRRQFSRTVRVPCVCVFFLLFRHRPRGVCVAFSPDDNREYVPGERSTQKTDRQNISEKLSRKSVVFLFFSLVVVVFNAIFQFTIRFV